MQVGCLGWRGYRRLKPARRTLYFPSIRTVWSFSFADLGRQHTYDAPQLHTGTHPIDLISRSIKTPKQKLVSLACQPVIRVLPCAYSVHRFGMCVERARERKEHSRGLGPGGNLCRLPMGTDGGWSALEVRAGGFPC